VAAVPVAFFVAALVGMVMERTVIRWLYGRPLETLLATWGLSLVLIQAARLLFGAQNVEVANPVWMSGGVQIAQPLLPWNRIIIVAFSGFVLLLVWLLMNKTRLGMFVRAVTQNRPMAGCVGVPTARIDTLAFGIGSGIAGLGGVALSQIANVGPDMGQGYIVDSFMVVVLGGVGQLAGAVWAALGLGIFSKFLEGWAGAVIAKIPSSSSSSSSSRSVRRASSPSRAASSNEEGDMRTPATVKLVAGLGPKGWLAVAIAALVAWVLVPLAHLMLPESHPLHVSTYAITLIGKIMCYAVVAVAMDLIWGYGGILSLGHGLFFALGGYASGCT
jgi:urea ABC transporter permease protein UrtB